MVTPIIAQHVTCIVLVIFIVPMVRIIQRHVDRESTDAYAMLTLLESLWQNARGDWGNARGLVLHRLLVLLDILHLDHLDQRLLVHHHQHLQLLLQNPLSPIPTPRTMLTA